MKEVQLLEQALEWLGDTGFDPEGHCIGDCQAFNGDSIHDHKPGCSFVSWYKDVQLASQLSRVMG